MADFVKEDVHDEGENEEEEQNQEVIPSETGQEEVSGGKKKRKRRKKRKKKESGETKDEKVEEKVEETSEEKVEDGGDGVEEGGDGGEGTKSKRKKRKKKRKKKGGNESKGEEEHTINFTQNSGSIPPPFLGVTGMVDSFVGWGQTNPPTIPVGNLFSEGSFPIGEILEHPGHIFHNLLFIRKELKIILIVILFVCTYFMK